MSAICQSFVQNAWKKDLCSNCFKSKDEHLQHAAKSKPVPVAATQTVEGIIKTTSKPKTKRNVIFTKELTQVIGFGGEVWSDGEEDDAECPDEDESLDEDDFDEPDDDQELKKLTKFNTDFNANSLAETVDTKKSFTHLMLGKPQLDAEGRKQTLLVTVTPFGQENSSSPAKKYTKSTSHIPIAKSNKDTLVEAKTNVVLTSYSKSDEGASKDEKSLLDEISETLENGRNSIQIVARKKIQKEIVLSVSKPECNKENVQKDNNNKIIADDKSKETKLNKSNIPERKAGITRTPVIKNQEKPAVFQTSIAKIELLNTKNMKLSGSRESLNAKLIKSEFNKIIRTEHNNNKEMEVPPEDKLAQGVVNSEEVMETSKIAIDSEKPEKAENKEPEIELEIVVTKQQNLLGLPPQVPKVQPQSKDLAPIPQSREQAGEPDGRADPEEVHEPPALPLTPPPQLEAHVFPEKPKVPSKPTSIHLRKSIQPESVMSTFSVEESHKLVKHDSNGSDIAKASNKRRAPKPPPPLEEPVVYTRNSTGGVSLIDAKEMRGKLKEDNIYTNIHPSAAIVTLRPALSMSTDNLTNPDEKKKDKRGRFSLKKFLRMGSKSDVLKLQPEIAKVDETDSSKPRLIIVHPLELNGAKVEVVAKCAENSRNEYAVPNIIPNQEIYVARAPKPLPPPRNLDEWKPLPHPPKSAEILNKQRQFSSNETTAKKVDSVYANIGEVRSAITPNKPQRTASMREREALQQKRKVLENYEPIGMQRKDTSENVYDYINSARSSSPEYDSCPDKNSPTSKNARLQNGQRSGSSVDVSGDYFKYQNIPRSLSLTYCGSETESEIYSPYSFYGSETEVAEEDHEWSTPGGRTHKLRSRKGRSIVHKNLEDNYGAVIVANHEALAQVLENIQHTTPIQPALRGLKSSANLRWSDFCLKPSASPLIVGSRAFHQATWGTQHVTLMISTGSTPPTSTFCLVPITEFNDLLPVKYLPTVHGESKHVQASVSVLPWLQVNTLQSYGEVLKSRVVQNADESCKDATFNLLQLVNALKALQSQGIEELPFSLTSFVLCREMERDTYNRLCVLQGLGEETRKQQDEEKLVSLCMCASAALKCLMPSSKTTPLIQSLLNNERAVSLTQVKSVLEFSLWGPSDVTLGNSIRERELALQRWLDLQRATVLHGLVCTKVQLTVYEECHLLFLVRSSAKMMSDASLLLESSNKQNGLNGRHK